MPIRIRTNKGKAVTLDETANFVEITNDRKQVAAVIYTDANGVVVVTSPGDKYFDKYCRLFNVEGLPKTQEIDHVLH
jgi:flagellar hook assembly protein FlgD